MTPREAALEATRRGWYAFRCRYRDKRPAVADWEHQATCDPSEVGCWPTGGFNVGLACGPSRLVLIDVDGAEAWERLQCLRNGRPLPATFTVATARLGGVHLWYAALPDIEVRNTAGTATRGIAQGVDTRGVGGFGVCPGSELDERAYPGKTVTLQNGGCYMVTDPRAPVPLPRWLAEASQRRPEMHAQPRGLASSPPVRATRYGQAALESECRTVATTPRGGHRNNQLNASAWKLGKLIPGGILDRAAVTAALMQAARDCQLVADRGEARCLATVNSGLAAGMSNPRYPEAVAW